MALRLMGKKRGMVQLFDKDGNSVPCTVIEVEPNVVLKVKSKGSKDKYDALQLGAEKVVVKDPRTMEKRVNKPQRVQFEKDGIEPRRYSSESRIDNPGDYEVGQEVSVAALSEFQFLDVMAISKGKGYQGVMKKYNFKGGPAAHGSGFHRHAGSTGMRSTPGRCFKNGPRPSQMGRERVTVQSLKIVEIDEGEGTVIVKGAVPGATNALVYLSRAEKIHTNR